MIDRRVREQCVESEILPLETSVDVLLKEGYKAIIISGGNHSFIIFYVYTVFILFYRKKIDNF